VIDYSIRIQAPAHTVFEMLTEAELLTEWMAREAEVDRRPGGVFRWVYENGDVVLGSFIEIDPPRRLVLDYGWEQPASRGIPPRSTTVEITLEEVDGATLLRLVHRGLPAAERDSHRAGWEYFLERLVTRLGSPTMHGSAT
jgi:uncharacterized protein YndB with AHSA1/START domain